MKVKGLKTQPTLPSCRCYDLRLKSKQCGSKAHDFDHSFTLLSTAGLSGYTSSHFKDEETVIQSLSCVQLFLIPWTAAHQTSLSFTSSWSLLKLMFIESVKLSNILSSVVPLSPCLQSFPASGSFPVSQLFGSGGQSIAASALVSVLPMHIQE